MRATFDGDGYPSDETLEAITNWNGDDYEGLARFACDAWNNDYGLFVYEEAHLKLVTGGWSGNESVISAMRANLVWWMLFWYLSKRGGSYEFLNHLAAVTP